MSVIEGRSSSANLSVRDRFNKRAKRRAYLCSKRRGESFMLGASQ